VFLVSYVEVINNFLESTITVVTHSFGRTLSNPGISHDISITSCTVYSRYPQCCGFITLLVPSAKSRIFHETTRYLVLLNMCFPNPETSADPKATATPSYKSSTIPRLLLYFRSEPYGFTPEDQFLLRDWWIYNRLWHRVVVRDRQLCCLASRYDNPQSETQNLATGLDLSAPERGGGVIVVTNEADFHSYLYRAS
jgi:hypothetical protein